MQNIPKTREEACSVLQYDIRMNRYDSKFIDSIKNKLINKNKPLSVKQNELWEQIVKKYKKQLKKIKIPSEVILELEWKNGIISNEELQKNTYFRIENDMMYMYFQFNKEYIAQLRSLIFDDEQKYINRFIINSRFVSNSKYDFKWNKALNTWLGPFNVHLFKDLYKFAQEKNINIDRSVETLYNELQNKYGTKEEWTPKLVISNNTLYINCITDTMLEIFNHYDRTDLSEQNIENICQNLCIEPPFVYNKYKRGLIMVNARSHTPYDTMEQEAQDELYKYLKGKKVLCYINTHYVGDNKKVNDFIYDNLITTYDLDLDLYDDIADKHDLLDTEYDVFVTTLKYSSVFSNKSLLKDIVMQVRKYIRIK